MLRFLAHRCLSALLVLFVVSLVTFVLIWLVPGDVASQIADPGASAEELAGIRRRLNLDLAWHGQMITWYGNLLQGNLGESFLLNRSVTQAIIERLPVTLSLTLLALLLALTLGIGAGVLAAVKHGTWVDQATMSLALVGLSIPDFWLGLVSIYVFSVWLGWLPASGYVSPFADPWMSLRTTIMPAFVLGNSFAAVLMRHTRSAMLQAMSSDYVRTARAKGLAERVVILKHAMRNALTPVITLGALELGTLLSGAVLTEQVFSIPGFGKLIVDAVFNRDYAVVQGVTLVTATTYILLNLMADVAYVLVNPRLRG